MWMNLLWWVLAVIVWDFIGYLGALVLLKIDDSDVYGPKQSLDQELSLLFLGIILGPISVILALWGCVGILIEKIKNK